eukprot:367695-Amphidinium_carterae.1
MSTEGECIQTMPQRTQDEKWSSSPVMTIRLSFRVTSKCLKLACIAVVFMHFHVNVGGAQDGIMPFDAV